VLRAGDGEHRFYFVETGEYSLDPARFRIDVDEFNNAIPKARSSVDISVAITWYERAVGLYKGNICKVYTTNGSFLNGEALL
jgi:hypothetical protein